MIQVHANLFLPSLSEFQANLRRHDPEAEMHDSGGVQEVDENHGEKQQLAVGMNEPIGQRTTQNLGAQQLSSDAECKHGQGNLKWPSFHDRSASTGYHVLLISKGKCRG